MKENAIDELKRRRPLWFRLLEICVALFLIATLLGFAGRWYWLIDLLSHFRVQYAIALVVLTGLALVGKTWRAAIAGGVALLISIAVIAPLFIAPPARELDASAPPLKIVSFNVLRSNRKFDEVAAYLNREQADLVLLMEIDDAWLAAMLTRLPGYRLVVGQGSNDSFGIALLARKREDGLEVLSAELRDITGDATTVESVVAHLRWHTKELSLLGIHTPSPISEELAVRRDDHLRAAAQWAADERAAGFSTLIIGDLNATRWSHGFRYLERASNLVDSERGFGWQPSLNAKWPVVLQIPIDHCLHSANLRTIGRSLDRRGYGSDHRPLAVSVQWLQVD